ncbi:MAG: hypothetical protein ACOYNO_15635 [Saprospiraceae bacterium]
MENDSKEAALPPDCFPQAALEAFLAVEQLVLESVYYYTVSAPGLSYLHALELRFAGSQTLLLASAEEEPAIQLIAEGHLLEAAYRLRAQGQVMERRSAHTSPLWVPVLGQPLSGVLLSKNADGLSLNDALVLDFGAARLLVHIGKTEGLSISHHH